MPQFRPFPVLSNAPPAPDHSTETPSLVRCRMTPRNMRGYSKGKLCFLFIGLASIGTSLVCGAVRVRVCASRSKNKMRKSELSSVACQLVVVIAACVVNVVRQYWV